MTDAPMYPEELLQALEEFCVMEKAAETAKWRDTLRLSVSELLERDTGLVTRVSDCGKLLEPESPGHAYGREGEKVCLLAADIDRTQRYTDVKPRGTEVFLGGVTKEGFLVLKRAHPQPGSD